MTSCPSGIPQGTLIINDPDIVTFTIESSLYHWGSSSCSGIEEGLSSTTLNADRRTVTVTAGVNRRSGQTAAIASFSELVFVALIGLNDSRNVAVYNTTANRMCPAEPITMPLTVPSVPSEVQIMRAFRSVKQPLPGNLLGGGITCVCVYYIHTYIPVLLYNLTGIIFGETASNPL